MSVDDGLPRLIAHVAVSLDMKVTGFPIDMGHYYDIASDISADASITGSNTYLEGYRPYWRDETEEDRRPPRNENPPWAILVDSRGITQGLLHIHRGSGYCRDVIVLHSKVTPEDFLRYLDERKYPHHAFGKDKVDLRSALIFLKQRYEIDTVRVDSGGLLISHLLNQGLCDELSLMVHPCIVGDDDSMEISASKSTESDEDQVQEKENTPLFCTGLNGLKLNLLENRLLENNILLLRYQIL